MSRVEDHGTPRRRSGLADGPGDGALSAAVLHRLRSALSSRRSETTAERDRPGASGVGLPRRSAGASVLATGSACCGAGLGRLVLGHADPPLPGWLGWKRHLGRLIVRLLFGVRTQDATCPFRLVRRSVFARMPLQSDGVFAHVEMLAKANFLGCLLGEEVPLGDRHNPETSENDDRGDGLGQLLADGVRVFRHPDFGPGKAAGVRRRLEAIPRKMCLRWLDAVTGALT